MVVNLFIFKFLLLGQFYYLNLVYNKANLEDSSHQISIKVRKAKRTRLFLK